MQVVINYSMEIYSEICKTIRKLYGLGMICFLLIFCNLKNRLLHAHSNWLTAILKSNMTHINVWYDYTLNEILQ